MPSSAGRFGRPSLRKTPVLLVSGVQEAAMSSGTMSLQFGLPRAVVVRHTIDPARQVLTRTVSDVTGTLEHESAPHVRVAAVVASLDAETLAEDLLSDALLEERGLATSAEDDRGVAEVAGSMVEYADVVCLTDAVPEEESSLIATLARPGTTVVSDPSLLEAPALAAGVHHHDSAEAWTARPAAGGDPGPRWRPRRSRGCFWLPTRARDVCGWDGAGGQISVGTTMRWGRQAPLTRIVVTGIDDDVRERAEIGAAFERCLLTDREIAERGRVWEESWDGLETWLGPIHHVA